MFFKNGGIFFFSFFFLIISCTQKSTTTTTLAEAEDLVKVGLALSEFGLGDQSFNDMQYNGLIEAFRRYDIEATFQVPEEGTAEAYRKTFIDLIENEGCDLVFACEGFNMAATVNELAVLYPDVEFVVMDQSADAAENVVYTRFAQNEGSFAVGVLAANYSKTGKIGFIGGVDIDVVKDFLVGFEEGIEYSGANVDLEVEYCSLLPDFSGFNLPEEAYDLAMGMYDSGIDIIYSVAGSSGNGVIRAASDSSNFVIGVDSDQDHMAPGFVLTSMMKRLDVAVYTIVGLYLEGELESGEMLFNTKNDGVSLTEMEYTKDYFSDETLEKVQKATQRIREGTITVESAL